MCVYIYRERERERDIVMCIPCPTSYLHCFVSLATQTMFAGRCDLGVATGCPSATITQLL